LPFRYLHDGREADLQQVIQHHGGAAALTREEQLDLANYLLSL